jgi:hypothetical protein
LFSLKAIMLWTIHDFLGYGVVTGVAHHGFDVCPICGLDFKGEYLIELRKMTYTQRQRWLSIGHPYRSEGTKYNFIGQLETCMRPKVVIAKEQLSQAHEYQTWRSVSNKEGGIGDPSKQHGVKR